MHRNYVSQSAAAHAGALQLYTLLPAAASVVTSMQTKRNSERLQNFLTRIKQTARDAHVQDLHHRWHMHVFAGRIMFLQ
jgi:hypothetical protein